MFFFTLSPISAKEGLHVSYTPSFANGAGVVISVKNLGDAEIKNLSLTLDIPDELLTPLTTRYFYKNSVHSGEEIRFKTMLKKGDIKHDITVTTNINHDDGDMIISFTVPKILFETVPLEGIALTFGSILIGLVMFVAYKNRVKK